jgi:hypothetical protein
MYYLVRTGTHTFDCHNMFKSWTALDGPDGMSLLSVKAFHTEDDQYNFESLDGVQPLGRQSVTTGTSTSTVSVDGAPTLDGVLTQEQADAISAIGLSVTTANTMADIRALAKQNCPGM